jgi:hypothetical protein
VAATVAALPSGPTQWGQRVSRFGQVIDSFGSVPQRLDRPGSSRRSEKCPWARFWASFVCEPPLEWPEGACHCRFHHQDTATQPRPGDRLREYKMASTHSDDTSSVFASKRGTHLNSHTIRSRVLAPATNAADMRWVTFHPFRRSAVRSCISGADQQADSNDAGSHKRIIHD